MISHILPNTLRTVKYRQYQTASAIPILSGLILCPAHRAPAINIMQRINISISALIMRIVILVTLHQGQIHRVSQQNVFQPNIGAFFCYSEAPFRCKT